MVNLYYSLFTIFATVCNNFQITHQLSQACPLCPLSPGNRYFGTKTQEREEKHHHGIHPPLRSSRLASTNLNIRPSSLTGIQQTQHQALIALYEEQELNFQAMLQGQVEDYTMPRSMFQPTDTPTAAPASAIGPHHFTLAKIGPKDNPEALLELFVHAAEACV